MSDYDVINGRIPIKAWTRGVPFAENAQEQLKNIALSAPILSVASAFAANSNINNKVTVEPPCVVAVNTLCQLGRSPALPLEFAFCLISKNSVKLQVH